MLVSTSTLIIMGTARVIVDAYARYNERKHWPYAVAQKEWRLEVLLCESKHTPTRRVETIAPNHS